VSGRGRTVSFFFDWLAIWLILEIVVRGYLVVAG
jgi:hypothetical protein